MWSYLGPFLGFLGIFTLTFAAPGRVTRQLSNQDLVIQCQQTFNLSCASLGNSDIAEPTQTQRADTADEECECVPYFMCYGNGTIIKDGSFIIDKRLGAQCSGSLETCCTLPAGSRPSTQTPTVFTDSPVIPTNRPTEPVITPPTPPTKSPVIPPLIPTPVTPRKSGCGYRNSNGIGVRITGRDGESQFAEFPWMVAILIKKMLANGTRNVYEAGGSLIHPRVVLTAAHHISGKSVVDMSVRAGEWDTQTQIEPIKHQTRDVQRIIMHENFNNDNLYNDVALLVLMKPVDIAPNVDVVCLPQPSDIFDAQRCTATGWGKDIFEQTGRFQAVLKKIDLPVVPNKICEMFLRRTRLGKYFELHDSFICAGGEPGKDTCTGDGGSPLICPLRNDPERYVQAGIVAWGIGCGADQTPGVYVNVAKARSWIDSQMESMNLGTSSYQI